MENPNTIARVMLSHAVNAMMESPIDLDPAVDPDGHCYSDLPEGVQALVNAQMEEMGGKILDALGIAPLGEVG